MIPRGEVVLIFAQLGLSKQLISQEWFAVLILLIFATAMIAPALLKLVLSGNPTVPVHHNTQLGVPGFASDERL